MEVPQLTQCCCGCKLRTGTKVIAWFAVVAGVLETINYLSGGSDEDEEKGTSEYTQEELQNTRSVAGIKCVLSVLRVIISFLLLQGAYKNKPGFYIPWIIYDLVAMIIECFLIIIAILIGVGGPFVIFLMVGVGGRVNQLPA